MRSFVRVLMIAAACLAAAGGAVAWLVHLDAESRAWPSRPPSRSPRRLATTPTPRPARPFSLLEMPFEVGGVDVASRYNGPIDDPASLDQIRRAIRGRGRRGIEALEAELASLDATAAGPQRARQAGLTLVQLGQLSLYEGDFERAEAAFAQAHRIGESTGAPAEILAHLTALRGIAALRRGEVSNCVECVGASSCIFPITGEAVHARREGAEAAVGHFLDYLERRPDDLRVRWLLNIAAMALGEYPHGLPPDQVVPLDAFRAEADAGRFVNVATESGLNVRGPNASGGSVFADFDGDARPDILTTSLAADEGARLFLNRGDGTFADRTEGSGLEDQVYALNLARADDDDDGDLDVLLLRGGWEGPLRMSLLRNRGDGTFEDATLAAGLGEPIASMAAAWGDYDADGDLDLYVCGEYLSPFGESRTPDPRNRSRLYRNRGDGTYEDVAEAAGVTDDRAAKGAAWGDYDGDGRLDLFVANMGQPCRLYHNEGDGTFRDAAEALGVTGPDLAFACWFWDFDNDGRLDIYVADNKFFLAEEVARALGRPTERQSRPHLYRNLGAGGFRDVAPEVGLDRALTPMGANFADVDNDGFLDLYFGTGGMSYEHLVPNRLLLNRGGRRFVDATTSSGTGHLQKGHGISFADGDADGDLDLFVQVGGPAPGDRSHNLLFRNPGHGRRWLRLKLVGTASSRDAQGARLTAVVEAADGSRRSIHRVVGNTSSFGGNALIQTIGLGDARRVVELRVAWPAGGPPQTFRDLPTDRAFTLVEGEPRPRPLRTGNSPGLVGPAG